MPPSALISQVLQPLRLAGAFTAPISSATPGRKSVVAPKLVNLDFSATKNNPIDRISETFNVQFRTEIFNILNHTNFVSPEPLNGAGIFDDTGAVSANGEMDSLATQPRNVQFAIKVIW